MSERVTFDSQGPNRNPDYSSDPDSKNSLARPDCEKCRGRGVIPVPGIVPPAVQECSCTLVRKIALNVERGWKGAMKSPPVPGSPLRGLERDNVWMTGLVSNIRAHVKHVAIRQPTRWFFRKVTDSDLIAAWLATSALKGIEIFDSDVAARPPSMEDLTLKDIALPSDLLIIELGVKRTANREMANVLFEALSTRVSEDKPTWIFDTPTNPFKEGHRAFSYDLLDHLNMWDFKRLEIGTQSVKQSRAASVKAAQSIVQPASRPRGNRHHGDDDSGDSHGRKVSLFGDSRKSKYTRWS